MRISNSLGDGVHGCGEHEEKLSLEISPVATALFQIGMEGLIIFIL